MPFDASFVEDGTGKATAVVYEQNATAAAWLVARGSTRFNALSDADQQVALNKATETAEDAVRPLLRGVSSTQGQGLLFPAMGAYLADGSLIETNALPLEYIRGIRLIAEERAAGTFMRFAGGVPGVKSEGSARGRIEYREGTDFSALATNHPDIWRKISTVIPP